MTDASLKPEIVLVFETEFQREVAFRALEILETELGLSDLPHGIIDLRNKRLRIDDHDCGFFFLNSLPSLPGSSKALFNFPRGKKYDYCISGMYSSFSMLFALSNIRAEKHILIDDGLATVRMAISGVGHGARYYMRKLATWLVVLMHGRKFKYRLKSVRKMVWQYFTVFRHSPIFTDRQKTIRLFGEAERSGNGVGQDAVIFVGQPLVELNMLPKELYTGMLDQLLKKFRSINYYPHPQESFIHRYASAHPQLFQIIHTEDILEKHFLEHYPRYAIVGVCSTALLNLKVIFPHHPVQYIQTDHLKIGWVYVLYHLNGISEFN